MTNKQKLTKAEQNLKATRRRINRLLTAERNWQRRVKYYMTRVAEEQAAEIVPYPNSTLMNWSGRKFR